MVRSKRKNKDKKNKYWFLLVRLILILVITLVVNVNIKADSDTQVPIPEERRIDWSRVGVPGGIPHRTVVYTTIDPDLYGDGVNDASEVINNAIRNCPEGQVVYLPAGTYRLNSPINFTPGASGVTLRGAGPGKTILVPDGIAAAINTFLSGQHNFKEIISGTEKGSTSIVVSDASNIVPGRILDICQADDPDFYWSRSNIPDHTGQYVMVTAVNGNTVEFEDPLIWTFDKNPRFRSLLYDIVSWIGIEDLTITADESYSGSMICFSKAYASWIKNVETAWGNGNEHIRLTGCLRCEIRDSYIHDTYSTSDGFGILTLMGYGSGMGGTPRGGCTGTLIENNIFSGFRKSIILETEGGSVVAYNYSRNARFTGWPNYQLNDYNGNHGPHGMMCLFEGNVGSSGLQQDGYHGSVSHITIFRNAFSGVHEDSNKTGNIRLIDLCRFSYYHNVIGNVLGNPDWPRDTIGRYEMSGKPGYTEQAVIYRFGYPNMGNNAYTEGNSPDNVTSPGLDPKVKATLMRWGNFDYQNNSVIWNSNEIPVGVPVPEDHNLPISLYHKEKPEWFGDVPWPPIGPDVDGLVNKIPAQIRYEALQSGDSTPPTTPKNLVGTIISQNAVDLTWSDSFDIVGVKGYFIYRDGTQIGTSETTSYRDTGLTAGNTYSYKVAAYDEAGNVSEQSNEISIKLYNVPEIEDIVCIPEYNSVYLSWVNPIGQLDSWDNVIVKRMEGNIANPEFYDGVLVYEGQGNSFIDRKLSQGIYTYAGYTYKNFETVQVYSLPCIKTVEIIETDHKVLRIRPDEGSSLIIGQNTKGDLYTLWNTEKYTIGNGPGGNETSLWMYSDMIGYDENQIPEGSKIISVRLVFNIEGGSFNDNLNPDKSTAVYDGSTHRINVYQIIDPDNLGSPHFTDDSGIRVGLDFNYRDHRPGINKPWVNLEEDSDNNTNDSSILDLFTDGEEGTEDSELDINVDPIDILKFNPDVFTNELLDIIKFDITAAVQSWANGEGGNQGLYITTGRGWKDDEYLTLSGITAEDVDKRPYIEVIYLDNDGSDLTPPKPVSDVSIDTAENSITLNWTYPDISASENADLAGIKIMRRERIIPFDEHDGDIVMIIDDISNAGTFTDTGLTTGKTYYYTIYTYDNEHNYSDKVWIKATPGSPGKVENLQISDTGAGTAELRWYSTGGADSYRIYRIDNPEETVNSKDNALAYLRLIDEIEAGQEETVTYNNSVFSGDYVYYVAAVNANGEGPLSDRITVTVQNSPESNTVVPLGLTGVVSGQKIELNWYDVLSETMYVVERKTNSGEWEDIDELVSNITVYTDAEIESDTSYTYRIKINTLNSIYYSKELVVDISGIGVKNITWEVISASQVKVEWEDSANEGSYKVELFELSEDGQIGDEEALDTQTISGITYCYFVTLESGKEYRVRITTIKGENIAEADSDIIRTSADSKGGLF